jgi:iron complex outermembrane recepter protein
LNTVEQGAAHFLDSYRIRSAWRLLGQVRTTAHMSGIKPQRGSTMMISTRQQLLASTLLSATVLLTAPAYAQQPAAATEGEAIVVTGSRISRPDLTAASPVVTITADQLTLKNKPGVEEFLRQIPQAVAAIGQNTNNGNPGVATINLRNLGSVRTLVLVDGHRFVPYDTNGVVDLNMIPASLIKRVDVVTGGASAVYGSDAVSGVVNFILKSDFTGLEANLSSGISERGDGGQRSVSLTGGLALGDRGHFIVSGNYTRVNKVTQGQRKFSTFSLAAKDFSPGGSSTNEFGSIDTPGGRFTFTPAGFVPYSSARDSFNFNPQNLLQVPQDKWTVTAIANYELTDNVEFFARGSYGRSKIDTEIGSSGTFGFSFNINYLTNPYLDPATNPNAVGARAILARYDNGLAGDAVAGDGIVRLGVRRRITELGPRRSSYRSEAWQGVGGLRGDFGNSFHWEIFGQYGKSSRFQAFQNDVSLTKLQQAILVVPGPSGPVCQNPSNGCTPANLFGFGTLSAAAANYIKFGISEKDTNDQFVAGGFVSGDLPLSLVADHPAAFVLGAEYRREKGVNTPDLDFILGNAIGYGSSSLVNADYNVKEVYGELKVPLLRDISFAQELGLEAGFRYSNYRNKTTVDSRPLNGIINSYANSFSNWTFKIGGDWKPVDALRFRVMYQRAVRAPNLQEIGQPSTSGTGDALFDPCAAGTFKASDATLRQLCLTVGGGMTAGQVGTIDQPTSGQVNNFSGGNPRLVPEVANTLTIGAIFQPRALPGFTASVDYFDIKVKKAILATPEQAILDACYYAERVATGTFCSLIKRNISDGSLEGDPVYGVDSTRRNIGLLQSRGLDVNVNYDHSIASGVRLNVALGLTRQLDSKVRFANILNTYQCVGTVGKTCLNPDPKWRWVQTTGIEFGKTLFQVAWRHLTSVSQDSLSVGYNFTKPADFVVPTIKSYDYFDLSVRFQPNDRFNLRFGVDNLLDKQPPVVGNDYGGTTANSGNTFPGTYDTLGRYFNIGATIKLF